jgi:glycosyltransferase involved in cell wall biosynthesis
MKNQNQMKKVMNKQVQLGPNSSRDMQVSVVIPVYNAAKYVRQAVESALIQPEVAEIILVEDASTDDSLKECQQIAADHPIVHLYRHPGGKNCGAGATRNLAIRKSSCEYIAFLDADDYYLPSRFLVAKGLFEDDSNLDGVYEAVAKQVENESSEQRWRAAGLPLSHLNTVRKKVAPEDLFNALNVGNIGGIHLNGLVIKRRILEKTGYFDEELTLHQDVAFTVKAAAVSKLVPGRLDEPVAIYRIHDRNRFSAPRSTGMIYKMKIKFRYAQWNWGRTRLSLDKKQLLLQMLINETCVRQRFNRPFPKRLLWLQKRIQLLLLSFDYPAVIMEKAFWQAFLGIYPGRKLKNA